MASKKKPVKKKAPAKRKVGKKKPAKKAATKKTATKKAATKKQAVKKKAAKKSAGFDAFKARPYCLTEKHYLGGCMSAAAAKKIAEDHERAHPTHAVTVESC